MPIEFTELLADDGWVPMTIDASNPMHRWHDGGPLADAPVDVAATFDGAMWRSTRIDPAFMMFGIRCRRGFTVPVHENSVRMLVFVVGGEVIVYDIDGNAQRVAAGQFWVADADTPFGATSGPDGVTYVENFPLGTTGVRTTWYDIGWGGSE